MHNNTRASASRPTMMERGRDIDARLIVLNDVFVLLFPSLPSSSNLPT